MLGRNVGPLFAILQNPYRKENRRIGHFTGVDNIGIQIDWFHANFEELNPYEAAMDAGDLLWHMHFRDSNSLTPGYGTVDFKAVIRALKKINYKGYCTIESAPMIPDSDTAAKDLSCFLINPFISSLSTKFIISLKNGCPTNFISVILPVLYLVCGKTKLQHLGKPLGSTPLSYYL